MAIKTSIGKSMKSFIKVFSFHHIIVFFQDKFESWLARRIPKQAEHTLNSRNIMIYPTRFGLAYLFFVVLVFLLGTNYQNNIILLFSYLLASLFITIMLHSFYNINQLNIRSTAIVQGYVGDTLFIPLTIASQKESFDINVEFADKTIGNSKETVKQYQPGQHSIKLSYKAVKRGLINLGRVTVYSEYSLGIFKTKTVLNFGHQALVFPQPKALISAQFYQSAQHGETIFEQNYNTEAQGTEDFSELKSFVQGESRARIAWKQLAKGQGHFSKHYQTSQVQRQCLKLTEMPGNDLEIKLRHLSFLIAELTAKNQGFSLDLSCNTGQSALSIDYNSGVNHQQECLTALAMYS